MSSEGVLRSEQAGRQPFLSVKFGPLGNNLTEQHLNLNLKAANALLADKKEGSGGRCLIQVLSSASESGEPISLYANMDYLSEKIGDIEFRGRDAAVRDSLSFFTDSENSLWDLTVRNFQVDIRPGLLLTSPRLQTLQIWNCGLEGDSLPSEIWKPEFRSLVVRETRLPSLPQGIAKAEKLRSLHLDGTGLTALPDGISQAPIRYLSASDNYLTSIPELPRNPKNEPHIWWFADNLLSALPDWAVDRECFFDLRGNPISHPLTVATEEDIGETQMETLDLRNNRIRGVPPWAQLSPLRQDEIDANLSKVLPSCPSRF